MEDHLQICPKCGQRTLLETETPHGQRLCIRCGIVEFEDKPED